MSATVQVPQILNISQYLKERPTEAVRTVLHQSTDMNLVLWQIPPHTMLPAHRRAAFRRIGTRAVRTSGWCCAVRPI